eukprot:CAMPEP_0174315316 /NCGR_PEP_ID=MMETSP0810-20121108/6210_1 /TAXON_ID=73025 ORGANISM="Eutreptiella gymnastica-like, Strain CCMP1594" /NCGR_SAMPLE_ID=MMETSP0810 /ASSEMBLY_ACC=CAM_ASM_000659 /LENGTH=396 /DNA_ID=CAMNT_0015424671 /DNA_START=17 /DNA_END=1207 /DNA_ORIENTATION=+
MPESSAILLHRHFSKLSDDTLRLCATHFDEGTLKVPDNHQALVGRNCSEVTSQGVDELLTTLLEDIPEDKHRLLNSTEKNQMELALLMKEDTLACMSKFSEHDRSIVVKALDIPESSPHAICEQIYINGLDAYLSQLAQHNKLEPLAKEFGVRAGAEDAVEQIIDQVFPPPASMAEPKKPEKPPPKKKDPVRKEPPRPPAKKEKVVVEKRWTPSPPTEEKLSYTEQMTLIRNTRPPLQKGISLDDIQNMYWVEELRQFCKDHQLKAGGKKSALNQVVFKYLNSGDVPNKQKRKVGALDMPGAKKTKLAAINEQPPPQPPEPQGDAAYQDAEDEEQMLHQEEPVNEADNNTAPHEYDAHPEHTDGTMAMPEEDPQADDPGPETAEVSDAGCKAADSE